MYQQLQCRHVHGNPQEACHYGPNRQLSWTYWCHCFEILSHRGDGCFHIMDALLFSGVAWLTHFLSPVTVYCRNSYSQSLWCVRCMRECPAWWTSWLLFTVSTSMGKLFVWSSPCASSVFQVHLVVNKAVHVSSAVYTFWAVLARCASALWLEYLHIAYFSPTLTNLA